MNCDFRGTRWTWLLALLFLLSACATPQNLGDEDRRKISVVRINSNVQKAPTMYYMGPGTGILMAGGAVGGAILTAVSVEPAKAFQDFAEKNGIFIEKIAFEEIDAALRQSGKFKVSDSAEPTVANEATINVLVYIYGYTIPTGFSSNLVPVLGVRCEMLDAAGKVVWRASDNVQILKNPANPMKLEAMQANPRYIEDGWRRAAKRIAGNIARAL